MTTWHPDDEELLDTIREALNPIPGTFITAGQAAFTWRNIDAELAELTYDSATDVHANIRADAASLRSLSFDAAQLTLELEISENILHGQLVPAGPGQVEIRFLRGDTVRTDADEVGYFAFSPLPEGRFRIYVQLPEQNEVLTDWIEL